MTDAINSVKADFHPDEAVELPSPEVVVEVNAGERLPDMPIEQLDDQTVLVNTINDEGDVVPAVGQLPPPVDMPTLEQIARDLGHTAEELAETVADIQDSGVEITHDNAVDVLSAYGSRTREQRIRRELGRMLTETQMSHALTAPEFKGISSDAQDVQDAYHRYRIRQTAEDREDNNPWQRR